MSNTGEKGKTGINLNDQPPIPPDISGYLMKLKRKTTIVSSGWNKRWFYVDQKKKEFGYGPNKNSESMTSSIFLDDITAVVQFDDMHFQVESKCRNFFLKGDCKATTASWVKTLEKYRTALAQYEKSKWLTISRAIASDTQANPKLVEPAQSLSRRLEADEKNPVRDDSQDRYSNPAPSSSSSNRSSSSSSSIDPSDTKSSSGKSMSREKKTEEDKKTESSLHREDEELEKERIRREKQKQEQKEHRERARARALDILNKKKQKDTTEEEMAGPPPKNQVADEFPDEVNNTTEAMVEKDLALTTRGGLLPSRNKNAELSLLYKRKSRQDTPNEGFQPLSMSELSKAAEEAIAAQISDSEESSDEEELDSKAETSRNTNKSPRKHGNDRAGRNKSSDDEIHSPSDAKTAEDDPKRDRKEGRLNTTSSEMFDDWD